MLYPKVRELAQSRAMCMDFRGLNLSATPGESEFSAMQNMSGAHYPALSPREPRAFLRQLTTPNGIFALNGLCWVDGTSLFYGGECVGAVTDSKKTFAAMGARILIWPDKVMYDTVSGALSSLEARYEAAGNVEICGADADGTAYDAYQASDSPPDVPVQGALWLDTAGEAPVLRRYNQNAAAWQAVMAGYVRLGAVGIGRDFAAGDGVTLSGCTGTLAALNGAYIIRKRGADFVLIDGVIEQATGQASGLTLTREAPDLDFLTESDNRVWGCRSATNEIYACKLGDPTNWNCFDGLSTDSYAATVGSAGDFTGAATHLGMALFFKEDVIHKVMGSKPANYQMTNTRVRGVRAGGAASLATVNGSLYYQSANGICTYDGSFPTNVSAALGNERFSDARAGALGDCYYVSMQNAEGAWGMYAYDERRGLWFREDDTQAVGFARHDGRLCFLDAADGKMWAIGEVRAGETAEASVPWQAETAALGMRMPDQKYVSKWQVRAWLGANATLRVSVQYDSAGEWLEKYVSTREQKGSFTVQIPPVRCDHLRMRFSGEGPCLIYSVARTSEQGSEGYGIDQRTTA